MTARAVVVGTAGHIDHGKTTLLRALTGIDADRLPEERRRGMTIDVGYAHLALVDGPVLDFVDVPGHERLVGNMLVGAGEVDAALLVVAADDGPRAQTREHLALLGALGIEHAVVALTKVDRADPARLAAAAAEVAALLAGTPFAGAPIVPVAAPAGTGVAALTARLAELAGAVLTARPQAGPPRLAVDRVFQVRGRGIVVTGTLRGGTITTGDRLRLVPGEHTARVREVQVHGSPVEAAGPGRTALLLGGVPDDTLRRGIVLTSGEAIVATSRLLVALAPVPVGGPVGGVVGPGAGGPAGTAGHVGWPADRTRLRLHASTDQADALVVRAVRETVDLGGGRSTAILRLDRPVAAAVGDHVALRGGLHAIVGGLVLDPAPARGVSRRRATPARIGALAAAVADAGDPGGDDAVSAATLDLHGSTHRGAVMAVAPDVGATLRDAVVAAVAAHEAAAPDEDGIGLGELRARLVPQLRRTVTISRSDATALVDGEVARLVATEALARSGDRIRTAGREALGAPVRAAMDRLVALLATPSPPPLAAAVRAAGCPPHAVRVLEAERRIVRLEDDLAWAAATYLDLVRRALALAARGPLTPAAFRDATGSSRRYVLAILEDLDRRGLLVRTEAGHRLGPKALARRDGA